MLKRILLGLLLLTQISLVAQRGNISSGGGNTYTTALRVSSGNGLEIARDVSDLPNIPPSWRGQALAIVIGEDDGETLRAVTDINNQTGYTTRFDFYLAADASDNDTFCSIAVAKGISALEFYDGDTPIARYIDLYKTAAGVRTIRVRIPTMSGELVTSWSGVVGLQVPIRIVDEYNLREDNHLMTVNGDTVLDREMDAAAIASIDTLVLGSSGGSTCRSVTYLIGRVLETPITPAPFVLPPPVPNPPGQPVISSNSIANGATSVPVTGQSLGCTSEAALTYDVYLDTVNPPVAQVLNDSTTCGYAMPQRANATTYYWQVKPSNAGGLTTGTVWSFTTVDAPANGDLDLIAAKAGCADSDDDSPTGRNPNLLWTCEYQAVWNQIIEEFEATGCSALASAGACSQTPSTRAARWFKAVRAMAISPSGAVTYDGGHWNAILYQMTGDPVYITHATSGMWKKLKVSFIDLPLPTNVDIPRIAQGLRTLMVEWAWPALTEDQRVEFVGKLDTQNDDSWWRYAGGKGTYQDPDQMIGQIYFPVAMMKVILPNNVSNNAIWADPDLGGFDATDCTTGPPPLNLRNAICHYSTVLMVGGDYLEGPMYAKETVPFFAGMAKAISNARGVDTYPELTTWLADHVTQQLHSYTPNLRQQVQFADEQDPQFMAVYHMADHLRALSGVLQGTDAGDKVHQLLDDMVAEHGETLTAPSIKFWGTVLYNPYADMADWKTSQYHFGASLGTQYMLSGFTDTDSLYFMHCPTMPFRTATYGTYAYHHQVYYNCAPYLYKNGEEILGPIRSYAGALAFGEGNSVMRFNGLGDAFEYKQVRQKSGASTHAFIASTTGGSSAMDSWSGLGKPPIHINEGSRASLHVPGAISTIIIHDRASVDAIANDNTDLLRYQLGCGFTGIGGRAWITQQHARQEWLWQIPVAPTVADNVFTWTTPVTKQLAKLTSLLPAAATRTVYDLNTTYAQALQSGYRCGWQDFAILPFYEVDTAPYNRKLLKIWPTTMGTFHTYLNVFQVGASTPATPTLITNNGFECAHVVTTSQNDILACFNNETSTVLGANYAIANKAILDSARLAAAGTRTIAFTAVAATTEFHVADLDPALTWTYNVDGAGAIAINGAGLTTTGGYFRVEIALAAGAHEIVVVGS